jgi:hypothetical protein
VARLAERMSRTAPADRRTLARLAAGVQAPPAQSSVSPEEMQAELAARWLPADQLAPARR